MSKEIPILFSTAMLQAVDKNRKTITRRTRNLKKINISPDKWELSMTMDNWTNSTGEQEDKFSVLFTEKKAGKQIAIPCPYGGVGDILWVRESFRIIDETVAYKSNHWNTDTKNWKSSIHMPKAACRLHLEVAGLRIERLHDITEKDAIAEGILFVSDSMTQAPLPVFKELWIKIHGKKSWDKNPWVWVIEFKKIKNYLEQKAGIQQATDDYKKQLQASCPHSGWVTGTAEGSYCVRCSKPLIG